MRRCPPVLVMVSILVLVAAACDSGSGLTDPVPRSTTTISQPFPSTSTTSLTVEPIEDDWTPIEIVWGVSPACCGQPAFGPVSPEGPISVEGWPTDGFYDVTTSRVGDPPGVLRLAIRRWVPCAEFPDRCPPDSPADGIVTDPATEVVKVVFMDDDLTVVIRPIQQWIDGRFPDPAVGITGSGWALYELLSGFCGGYLPPRNTTNCGVDHAFIDWVWDPYQTGSPLDEIEQEIVARGKDPAFPLGQFDDGSSDMPCSADRSCPIAYRGPQGAHLVITPGLVELLDTYPGYAVYGWWTSLEIRNGHPILHFDAGQVAG